ncbi:EAL domain-containing protein [Shewanella sp. NIFS-20-20]|uniref:EAL domain-containing protein n=1 Tax=Shewanella sp. NIFS-20-20 TaxID=2853806 RepID=UPI001C4893DD|nr:EAL domain-containing protein [Shewanella sp. NIFS-20-20]MBV7317556.1 EAL domain-containing protein [Shewanella sp. NIFS-20-20]
MHNRVTAYQQSLLISCAFGLLLVCMLTLSLWMSKYTLTWLLTAKGERLESFHNEQLQQANTQMNGVAKMLAQETSLRCDAALIALLQQQIFEHNEPYVPIVFLNAEQQFCSGLGVMPAPKSHQEMASNITGLGLFKLKDSKDRVTVYAGVNRDGFRVFRRLYLRTEVDTWLKRIWYLSGLVVKVNGYPWFSLDNSDDIGVMVTNKAQSSSLTFELNASQAAKNNLWFMYFVLLVGVGGILGWLAFHARGYVISKYWYRRFTHGLKNEAFYLEYQPVINSLTDEVVGAEAFIRWRVNGQLLPTLAYIGQLEQNPAMGLVTQWVIENAFTELKSLLVAEQLGWLSINISAQDIDSGVVISLLEKWQKQDFPLNKVFFELTERQPIADWSKARAFIDACHHYGCGVKLDDAGAGFGGHLYLQKLTFDTIKIDGVFVGLLGTPASKLSLLTTYVEIAKEIGANVIAEGVETAEQARLLQQLGIDWHQGWLYAKAMDASDFRRFMLK